MASKFILSIDGGGIRGLIPATVLCALEARLKAKGKQLPLHRYFNLIAGTSTGAILAAGLTCPKSGRKKDPVANAKQLVDLYKEQGGEIFDTSFFRKLSNGYGLLGEQYDAKPLEAILVKLLGEDTLISAALTYVLIPAYDIHERQAVFMSNTDAKHASIRFWQAARGSSAAPTYFEPALVEDLRDKVDGVFKSMPLIDGGVFANDPALAAYVEGRKLGWNEDEIVILSLGTGQASRKIPYNQAKDWGAAGWISPTHDTPLISVLMQGQASTASYQVNQLLNGDLAVFRDGATTFKPADRAKVRYFRIDGPLTSADIGPSDALDDATEGNLDKLATFGERLAASCGDSLDEIADRVTAIG